MTTVISHIQEIENWKNISIVSINKGLRDPSMQPSLITSPPLCFVINILISN